MFVANACLCAKLLMCKVKDKWGGWRGLLIWASGAHDLTNFSGTKG